jgi:predicted transcriptional regulator
MSRAADALEDAGMTELALRLYDLLIQGGPMSRDALVQKSTSPRTSVFDAAKMLAKIGLLARRPHYIAGQSRGRPKVEFYIVGRD